jgi:hypothetical protein
MKEFIARILLITDFHFMAVPAGQQKGQIIRGINRIVEGVINIWKRGNNRRFYKALEKINSLGEFDRMVTLGDILECEFNERGILQEVDLSATQKIKRALHEKIKTTFRMFISGDHELGYKLPLSVDPEGGISKKSVENYQKTIGRLWYFLHIKKWNCLFLSSSLIKQKFCHGSKEEIAYLEKLKRDQLNFVSEELDRLLDGEKVLIFLHDPDVLEVLENRILKYHGKKKIKVFCGHMHAESSLKSYERLGKIANSWFGKKIISKTEKGKKVMDWAKGNLKRMEIFKKYNLQIVPALGGMMGKGGGFLILNLCDDGSFEIEKHKI